jgi:M6 family metalloprotease-like protein
MSSSSSDRPRRRRGEWLMLVATAAFLAPEAAAQTRGTSFLGLSSPSEAVPDFWEGRTNYRVLLRPKGDIRAIMLFARFPDAESQESTQDLFNRLVPEAAAFFKRASYGEMTLTVDVRHRWIAMDNPSTWASYDQSKWDTHKTYVAEVARKTGKDVDFGKYDIVYIVGSKNKGTPKSPTFLARPGTGIRSGNAEIRHAVTLGNDIRNRDWGWQTLAHETGHVFGLPDLYNHKRETPRYKDVQRHVGCWDVMGNQQAGSEYLAWHKYKLGWLSDQSVLVAKKTSRTALITPIDEKGGVKAVVVPINDVEAYVVEVRSRPGQPKSETGVLCYKVSLTIANGQGPIQVIPARPDDNNPELERSLVTLYNALFFKGPVITDEDRRIKIEILGREGRAYRIGVTR